MLGPVHCLLCQVGASYLAFPLSQVIEVLRPLALQRIADAPAWLLGLSVQRGVVTPVLDAELLLHGQRMEPAAPAASAGARGRWVALHSEQRRIALAVDAVKTTTRLD